MTDTAPDLAAWLDTVATAPGLPPAAIRIAIAIAAAPPLDTSTIVARLALSPEEAAEAVGALAAGGLIRTLLKPIIPSPPPVTLSPASRGALAVLHRIGTTVPIEAWRLAFALTMPDASPNTRRKAWERARAALIGGGFVTVGPGGVVASAVAVPHEIQW